MFQKWSFQKASKSGHFVHILGFLENGGFWDPRDAAGSQKCLILDRFSVVFGGENA